MGFFGGSSSLSGAIAGLSVGLAGGVGTGAAYICMCACVVGLGFLVSTWWVWLQGGGRGLREGSWRRCRCRNALGLPGCSAKFFRTRRTVDGSIHDFEVIINSIDILDLGAVFLYNAVGRIICYNLAAILC